MFQKHCSAYEGGSRGCRQQHLLKARSYSLRMEAHQTTPKIDKVCCGTLVLACTWVLGISMESLGHPMEPGSQKDSRMRIDTSAET